MQTFKLRFVNSEGTGIELYSRPYRLVEVNGLSDVDADVYSYKLPYQSGERFINARLRPREIKLLVKIVARDYGELESLRVKISRVFNPELKLGTLMYESENKKRVINAVPTHLPIMPDGNRRTDYFQYVIIDLYCPTPYWESIDSEEQPMSAYTELFNWPSDLWPINEDGAPAFNTGIVGEEKILINDGDVETPVEIFLVGPSVKPRITNETTGQSITINDSLDEGDTIYINTETSEITKNGEDIFHKIHWNTEFWYIKKGKNIITYKADEGETDAKLTIKWKRRYNAV